MISASSIPSSSRLLLLRLMFNADWMALKDVKPALNRSQREDLIRRNLIDTEKRGRAIFARLSDRGWVWCSEHLNEPLGIQRSNAAEILEEALGAIHSILKRHDLSLAKILLERNKHSLDSSKQLPSIPMAGEAADPREESSSLFNRIREAALDIGLGESRVRVPIARLRVQLKGVSFESLDHALIQLAQQGKVQLLPYDNPLEITSLDRDAALRTPSGEVRHLVYWIE